MKNKFDSLQIKKENFTVYTNTDNDLKENDDDNNENLNDGCVKIKNNGHFYYCMTIIGQIEGHYILPSQNKTTKYEHVIPKLVAIEENEQIDGLLLILNTVGGDVEAGLAIAEMKKPSVSLVLGGGHSIGVPLAVAAKKSLIAKSATMTVHPVRINGLVLGVEQSFEYFRNMQERIVRFVSDNSNISPDKFRELMLTTGELVQDLGIVLNGDDAVKTGLIDAVGSLADAISLLDTMCSGKDN